MHPGLSGRTITQVWRCWHVWGGNWRVCVVPILLIIASAGKCAALLEMRAYC